MGPEHQDVISGARNSTTTVAHTPMGPEDMKDDDGDDMESGRGSSAPKTPGGRTKVQSDKVAKNVRKGTFNEKDVCFLLFVSGSS